jgi:hypothetical protein
MLRERPWPVLSAKNSVFKAGLVLISSMKSSMPLGDPSTFSDAVRAFALRASMMPSRPVAGKFLVAWAYRFSSSSMVISWPPYFLTWW